MECIEFTEQREAEWAEFVEGSADASLGHDIGWRYVLSEALNHTPRYLLAVEDKRVEGILPLFELRHRLLGRRLVSVPVLDRAGIIAGSDAARDALLAGVQTMVNKGGCRFAQLRRCASGPDACEPSGKAVLLLDISRGIGPLWDSLKAKVRNQVRKAEKAGLTAEVGGVGLVDDFFYVYSRNMRDLGVPVLPLRLFTKTAAVFGHRARIIAVRLGREPVGAGVLIFFKDVATVPWASSSRRHFELCPNNLLYWTAISTACDHACSTFDFGRSTWDSGPFRFKKQWGAEPIGLDWDYCIAEGGSRPNFTTDNPKYRLFVRMWQRLPVPLANIIGPAVSRQVA